MRYPGLQWISIGALVLVLALIWLLTWQRLRAEAHLLEKNAELQQRSLAAIIAENLAQVVDRSRLMAATLSHAENEDPSIASARLTSMLASDRTFLRLALYDSSFERKSSSSPFADGPEVKAFLQRTGRAQSSYLATDSDVQVGPQLTDNAWQVPLLVSASQGPPAQAGHLLAMLDLGYFLQLYRNIDMGSTGSVFILGLDGTEIAEARPEGLSLRAQPRHLPQFAPPDTEEGSWRGLLHASEGEQLARFQRVDRAPFIVVVSRGVDEIHAAHVRSSQRVGGALGLLSLILAGATGGLVRSTRRQQALLEALQASDKEKHGLIVRLESEKSRAMTLASFDHLTGLHNRRMFNEIAASHLEGARRSHKHYMLMYLDLDRFKLINDTLGHHVGDKLLKAFGERLRTSLRSADVVGRMGGDEFAVLVTALDNPQDMDLLAQKLVAQLSRPYPDLDGHDIHVSPSIGIACFPRDGHDVTTLCRHADAAMYESKRMGRARFTYYDADQNQSNDRALQLERQLPGAIESNELVLHFQPKVHLADYRITGLEALVRWQHPDFGLVHPGEFIAAAERSGLIIALGDWVLRACCAQQAEWKAQGIPVVPLAFNVSPMQLRDGTFARTLTQQLQDHGLSPADLEIEITENCLVEPVDRAIQVLEDLQRRGIRIGLDDFGSGFSSLSQIRDLPISTIKIDRSFINAIRSQSDVGVIVTSIITLAHGLQMRVVAEGVELMNQLVQLKMAGCDEVQGYFLHRPVPGPEARNLLKRTALVPT